MNILSKTSYDILNYDFGKSSSFLFKNEIKNQNKSSHGRRYSEEVKKFAVTLHYHSPKAYAFCRTIIKLPHPSAIRNWNSTVDASPGFQQQVLDGLKNIPEKDKDCNLIFDSMAIKKELIWDEQTHRFIGFCDYGNNITLENNEYSMAKRLITEAVTEDDEALVYVKGLEKRQRLLDCDNAIVETLDAHYEDIESLRNIDACNIIRCGRHAKNCALQNKYSLFRRLLFLRFQVHTDFRLGFHSRPDSYSSSLLSESRIFRGNAFPRLLCEYVVSYVSFREIFVTRVSYVVFATRLIERINASIASSQTLH
ncbi:THAP domain-containing protein 9 [Cyphomyrmex costatus]|uniref:THAP domain-containing protein 9 n=1 Tax=Cyphomyrmex costatus TaxID=456900 RepID=A0A151I9L9_9HYME|nr:THAP domain-containing protein 9 [Cyphomyrmex costatus]